MSTEQNPLEHAREAFADSIRASLAAQDKFIQDNQAIIEAYADPRKTITQVLSEIRIDAGKTQADGGGASREVRSKRF